MTTGKSPPPQLGQAVVLAQRALIPVRDDALDRVGSSFEIYAALNVVATGGGTVRSDVLHRGLAAAVEAEPAAVSELVGRLEETGLVQLSTPEGGDRRVELTPEGEAHLQRLRESLQQLTTTLLDGLDPDDVQATMRTLHELTQRAKALEEG
jgi:DNA-binding MarR family transcriptional regulator